MCVLQPLDWMEDVAALQLAQPSLGKMAVKEPAQPDPVPSVVFHLRRLTAMSRPVGWCSRLAGGAVWCRGAQLSCGLAAARRRGSEQWGRSGFVPACRRCRFLAEILLNLFVDKPAPELLCSTERRSRPFAAERRCADTGATARDHFRAVSGKSKI